MSSFCPAVFALMTITALAAPPSKKAPQPTETDKRQSYALGQEAGLRAKRLGVKIDLSTYQKAFTEALKGKTGSLTREAATKLIKDLEMESTNLASKRNKEEGAAFLAANKQKPGIKVTASGLQFESLREGSGAHPTAEDSVKVHYRGTLADGTEFDSSYARNEPATFPLKRVIKGWTEGLQLVKVGGKAKLYVPFELAYGEAGRSPVIPPAAMLIFEVELLAIEPAKK